MDSELWKQADNLLQAALEHPASERAEFLRQACAGDEALEREVQSLLVAQEKAASFLDRPATEVAGRSTTITGDRSAETTISLVGQTISHYRIVEKLGSGGMGIVYKAEDTRLHRFVALKFLPDEIGRDPHALGRFQREARAASALSHPNICTIFDVLEEQNRQPVIVMELLEGQSVKDKIHAGLFSLDDLLHFAIQTSDALEAAHAKGIIHRDIKPANLFLTRRGDAKILDFGLAKLDAGPASPATETATIEDPLTSVGNTVGTVSYMSPEQVRAEHLDARTDLFSFGVVLYEMATGKQPFRGDTSGIIFDCILNRAPVAPVRLNPDLPPEVERIVNKCLEKDRNLRYQHAADIRSDLKRLERDSITGRVISAETPVKGSGQGHLKAKSSGRWKIAVPAAVAALATAAAVYFYAHRAPKLTDKDTIVLADFDNKTGDPVFDDTLRQGLSVELQQSPFLNLVSDAQIQRTLTLMGQPKGARLTPEIAQHACERTGSAAVLEGSIASLGSRYVLGLRAKNCNTGSILDQEQTVAAKREDVLNSLSQIASKFRTRMGESLATVEKHSTPLAEATTPSLEALKAYSTGMKVVVSSGNEASIPLLRRAVEIDPKFAMAYAQLGVSYGGESLLSAENTTKAWRLRDRVSDRERFFIDFTYDRQVTGNLEKAYQTLELWYQIYPRGENPNAQGFLGGIPTQGTGRYARAMEMAQKRIADNPDEVFGYSSLAHSYLFQDRFAEAETTLQRASERKLETPDVLLLRYNIAMLRGDQEQIDRTARLARGKRKAEPGIAHQEALGLARSGRLQAARRSSGRAVDLALQAGERETAAGYLAARAVWEAAYGDAAEGKRNAIASLELSKGRDVQYAAGLALALAEDVPRSEALAGDLERNFPEDTFAKFTYVPVLRALAALRQGKPAGSLERLQTALQYELAVNGLNFNNYYLGGLHSAYVRGEALVATNHYAEAVAEFQKILDHRGIVGADPIGALVHLQRGRVFALSGDKAKSKAAYEAFFALWKDADPNVPILKSAKAEYERLL